MADKYTQTQHLSVIGLVPILPTFLHEHIDSTSKPKVKENNDPSDPSFNRNSLDVNSIHITLPSPETQSQEPQASWGTSAACSARVSAGILQRHEYRASWLGRMGKKMGWEGSLERSA